MTSILKVDTIQTAAGGTPTAASLGIAYDVFDNYKVNQFVQATNISGSSSSTLNTWFTVGSLLITPVSTSSVLLISANMQINSPVGGSFNTSIFYGSSELFRLGEINVSGRFGNATTFLHVPGVTSEITYSIRWLKESGSDAGTGIINGINGNMLHVTEYVPV